MVPQSFFEEEDCTIQGEGTDLPISKSRYLYLIWRNCGSNNIWKLEINQFRDSAIWRYFGRYGVCVVCTKTIKYRQLEYCFDGRRLHH